MISYVFCPISEGKINERVTRMNAILTVLILLAFVFTGHIVWIIFLFIDFMLRAVPYSKFSPVGITSRNVMKYLPAESNFINAGPKIFAARVGAILSGLIGLSLVASFSYLAMALTGILGLFALLEGAFGICVACKIYPYLYKAFYKKDNLS